MADDETTEERIRRRLREENGPGASIGDTARIPVIARVMAEELERQRDEARADYYNERIALRERAEALAAQFKARAIVARRNDPEQIHDWRGLWADEFERALLPGDLPDE